MDICFATNNPHKLEEVRAIVKGKINILSLKDVGCYEELLEEQDTLEGNSRQKANYVFEHFGVSCFADDTGLEVDALQRAPGVYSARYAGAQRNSQDNITLLLRNLEGKSNRVAQFRTVVTLIQPTETQLFQGIVQGTIINSLKGTGGFGYDPIFQPQGYTITMAEMNPEDKNTISHRGIAIRKLATFLLGGAH